MIADFLKEDEEDSDLPDGFPGIDPVGGKGCQPVAGDGASQGNESVEEGGLGDAFAGLDRRKCQNPEVGHLDHFRSWGRKKWEERFN